MNLHIGSTFVTRAGEGHDRPGFTAAEIEAMVDTTIIGPEQKFKRIEGDVILVRAKNNRHERIKHGVPLHWSIDASERHTLILCDPRDDVMWGAETEVGPEYALEHPVLPGLAARLDRIV